MTDDQIKHMASRFLGWRLPQGTNLFDATQAEAMVRYMTVGMPLAQQAEDLQSRMDRIWEPSKSTAPQTDRTMPVPEVVSSPKPAPGVESAGTSSTAEDAPRPLTALCDAEWQALLDKDDRTSPAEYPDMVLIKRNELGVVMSEAYLLARQIYTPREAHYPTVETIAQMIYERAFDYNEQGIKPKWVFNGNSDRQIDARAIAALILAKFQVKP